MTNPYNVRPAMPDDAEALVRHVIPIFSEGALQPVSVFKIEALVKRCIDRDGAIAGIIDGPGGIEASIGLVRDSFEYSDQIHLAGKWLGVAPEFRRVNHASTLLQFARWASTAMSVPLHISVITATELEQKLLSYQRQIPQCGASFAWGFLPDTELFNQAHVAQVKGSRGNSRNPPRARPALVAESATRD